MGMNRFVNAIKEMPSYKYAIVVLRTFVENYIETGTEGRPSKFDFGPVNTIISNNYIDGLRFRVGGKTTANFHPNLFLGGM